MKKNIKVIKRDGTTEEYSEEKVKRVVKAAGLSDEQVVEFTEEISTWIMTLTDTSLTSLQIRDMILEKLPKINPSAADLYKWYESTKESNS